MGRTGQILIRAAISGLALWMAKDASHRNTPCCHEVPPGALSEGQAIVNDPGIGNSIPGADPRAETYAWSMELRFARLFTGKTAPLGKRDVGGKIVPVKRIGTFLPGPAPLFVQSMAGTAPKYVPLPLDVGVSPPEIHRTDPRADLLVASPLRGPPTASIS